MSVSDQSLVLVGGTRVSVSRAAGLPSLSSVVCTQSEIVVAIDSEARGRLVVFFL